MSKKPDKHKNSLPAHFRSCHTPTNSKEFWGLPGKAVPLYFYLCKVRNRHTNGKIHSFWHTDSQIIAATGWDERTIKKARRELRDHDLIGFMLGRGNKPTTYTILDEFTYLDEKE